MQLKSGSVNLKKKKKTYRARVGTPLGTGYYLKS
jgi:hypothetical protein